MKFSIIVFFLSAIVICNGRAQNEMQVNVETLTKSTASWNGSELTVYPDGTPEITILKYIIPPNTTLPWHQHPVINAAYILNGELTIVTREGEQINLVAGESMVETVDTWHRGINEHPEPVEIIVFYAGILNEPLTIQE